MLLVRGRHVRVLPPAVGPRLGAQGLDGARTCRAKSVPLRCDFECVILLSNAYSSLMPTPAGVSALESLPDGVVEAIMMYLSAQGVCRTGVTSQHMLVRT